VPGRPKETQGDPRRPKAKALGYQPWATSLGLPARAYLRSKSDDGESVLRECGGAAGRGQVRVTVKHPRWTSTPPMRDEAAHEWGTRPVAIPHPVAQKTATRMGHPQEYVVDTIQQRKAGPPADGPPLRYLTRGSRCMAHTGCAR
jgi:hypothetical protein